jgi:hypothetical protein
MKPKIVVVCLFMFFSLESEIQIDRSRSCPFVIDWTVAIEKGLHEIEDFDIQEEKNARY